MSFGTFENLVTSCVHELSFVLNNNVHKQTENKEFNIIEFLFDYWARSAFVINLERNSQIKSLLSIATNSPRA